MKKFWRFLFLFLLVVTIANLTSFWKPQSVYAADCGGPIPPTPMKVWAKSGPAAGEVTLYWDGSPHANRYAVAYGTVSNNYKYGADNIGGEASRSYTVRALAPGTKYYFRLAAARDACSSGFATEVWAYALGGQVAPTQMAKPTAYVPTPMAVSQAGPVGKQMLWAKSGPKTDEVTLYWKHADDANNYHLVYGTEHGKFKFGALNIGWVTSFTVRKLAPGVTYHFALVPVKDGNALYTTDQVMATAWAPAPPMEVVTTTKEQLMQPKPTQRPVVPSPTVPY